MPWNGVDSGLVTNFVVCCEEVATVMDDRGKYEKHLNCVIVDVSCIAQWACSQSQV